jgi:hypothetical protein
MLADDLVKRHALRGPRAWAGFKWFHRRRGIAARPHREARDDNWGIGARKILNVVDE